MSAEVVIVVEDPPSVVLVDGAVTPVTVVVGGDPGPRGPEGPPGSGGGGGGVDLTVESPPFTLVDGVLGVTEELATADTLATVAAAVEVLTDALGDETADRLTGDAAAAAGLAAHAGTTTGVHGIADTAELATRAYADAAAAAAAAGVVDAAPETLDTLYELAAALGDDPDYAATTATLLGQKATSAQLAAEAATRAQADGELADDLTAHAADEADARAAGDAAAAAALAAHAADTTGVHGIPDTTALATAAEVAAAVAALAGTLGTAATRNVGTAAGDVAAGNLGLPAGGAPGQAPTPDGAGGYTWITVLTSTAFTAAVTSTGDVTARQGTTTPVSIGAVGPSSAPAVKAASSSSGDLTWWLYAPLGGSMWRTAANVVCDASVVVGTLFGASVTLSAAGGPSFDVPSVQLGYGRASLHALRTATPKARDLPAMTGPEGATLPVGDALWARTWWLATPSDTGWRSSGSGASAGSQGTYAGQVATAALPYRGQNTTAATANARAYTGPFDLQVFRGAASDAFAGFELHALAYYPDASYNAAGASTGSRLRAGFMAGLTTGWWDTDRGDLRDGVFFERLSTAAATDANWQVVTCDATTKTVTDTTMPFTAQHLYAFHLWCQAGGTSVKWAIEDLTAGTYKSGTVSATLPRATAALNSVVGLTTINAVARNSQVARLFVAADKS